jgi:methylated-DNA-[protein]-cysteine S-methyltransferase
MPATLGYACFATAIGECALAWSDAGLTGVWLPDERAGGLRRRLARRLGAASEREPPAAVAAAIAAIVRLLGGAQVDLGDVALDFDGIDAFARRVYEVARAIAPGRVLSYGAIARQLGSDATARAVGQALGANRFPIVVPCHRVVAKGGELGGFSAPGGVALKRRLLTLEDARFDGPPDLFDASTADAADALADRERGVRR